MHGAHVASTLSRRHFILTAVTATGGFMIGIGAAPRAAGAATVGIAPGSDENAYSPNDIDAWIAIDPDDSILIRYQRSEMGQGSMTALPMMIAEELSATGRRCRSSMPYRTGICGKIRSMVRCSRTAACQYGHRKRRFNRLAPARASVSLPPPRRAGTFQHLNARQLRAW
jgi:CO/xanthine dehydrogenase Mo-binding subunit